MPQPILEIKRLSKTFPGLKALDDVELSVRPSEVVAIVGENGSGKSTLAKVLAGVHEPDRGAVLRLPGPDRGQAQRDRLHFIHQDLGLIPTLSTVENLDLARKLGRRAFHPLRGRAERHHARDRIARFGASFDVDLPVEKLSPAERAIVAITRALDGWTRSDNILVLDEPTEALHGDEVDKLCRAVREVAQRGAGVIFISHRLGEVIELADRVVVLRNARVVGELRRGEYDRAVLTELIVGTELREATLIHEPQEGVPVLQASGVSGPGVTHLDLTVRPGEIVGVTGVLGSGRERVCGLLYGAVRRTAGEIRVGARSLKAGSPPDAMRSGVAYVPAERKVGGAVMGMSVRENLMITDLPVKWPWRLDLGAERRTTAAWIDNVDLRPRRPDQPLRLFSGGNQQKIVLAKWLRNDPQVLLLDEPTQGVDVGAKTKIYELIAAAANRGAGVIVCSADTRELTVLCDRVLVMRDGRVALELARGELSESRLVAESIGSPHLSADQEEVVNV